MEKKGTLTAKMLAEKKSEILEEWVKAQLSAESHRQDLMSFEELRKQSEEFLDELVEASATGNLRDM